MNWTLDLNAEPKSIMEARQEASMAQRVLNDAVFVDFLDQMQHAASNTALFDDKLETNVPGIFVAGHFTHQRHIKGAIDAAKLVIPKLKKKLTTKAQRTQS